MGSYEIDRSSDESIQGIVAVDTPSPLTSSHSSDSNNSLLTGINELTFGGLSLRLKKRKEESSGEEAGDEDYPEADNPRKTKIISDSESISLESSASSLKRRLQDLPSPIKDTKLADRVAALDRRIRREKEIYLQLQGLADRIEEKDEGEASSVTDSASKTKLHPEDSATIKDARARRRAKMSSSAPDTMRLEKEAFKQPLHDFATSLKKPLAKKYDERRPPKYLQPLEDPVKEILRCNAPPLCLSDKKIAELLRRGSVSAREDYLRKTTKVPAKIVGYKKPTGMIIKNLSSGSEEDSTSNWLIRGGSSVAKFESGLNELKSLSVGSKIEEKSLLPQETSSDEPKNNVKDEKSYDFLSRDNPRSSQNSRLAKKSSEMSETQVKEDTEASDDLPSSRSSKMMKVSLQNSMAQLKSVLREIDSNPNDLRPLNLPKLDIQSREYSQSTSQASREDSTKRSLDMKALFRALSDVSIKQQEVVDQKLRTGVCDSAVSASTEPRSSAYTSVANESRQSMASAENAELQEARSNYSKIVHRSRDSVDFEKRIKCTDRNLNGRSKIPIVVGDTEDLVVSKEDQREHNKMARKKIIAEEFDVSDLHNNLKRAVTKFSPTKKNLKCRSTNFIDVSRCSIKLAKVKSPEAKSGRSKSPRINFQSFDSLLQDRENQENYPKVSNGSAKVVLFEPGTSRNGRIIPQDHLSSRVTSGVSDILQRDSPNDRESSDDKFKYLQRGSKIPYIQSSSESGSSSEQEENDFEPKILRPSSTGFQSADQLKSEERFKIYEDIEEAPPEPEFTFPVEEMNAVSRSRSNSRREIYKSESKTTCMNGLPARTESQLKISSLEVFNDCKSPRRNDEEKSKDMRKLTEGSDLFWADSSTVKKELLNSTDFNKSRSCSKSTSSEKMKQSSTSSESSSKLFSNRSPITSGSSCSPRFANNDAEKLFSASSIAKRLSYSELQTSNLNDENSEEESLPERKIFLQDQPEISSPEELPEEVVLNSSRTNLAATGRSSHQFRRAFELVPIRPKVSSSLSKLTRSPDEPDLAFRRKSQDRFPFTISESTSAKSSSKFKAEQAIQGASGYVIIEPSETAYRLRVHPSLLRLAGAGIEATAEEIIESASRDPEIIIEKASFVKKFVRRFSSRWGKSRCSKNKPGSGTTKILYENKKCRSESSGSASAEKPSQSFNRDGLWIEGLRDETHPDSEEEKDHCNHTQQLRDIEEQETIDRYSMFLAKRENQRRQFSKYGFSPKTPMNSLINDENSDNDPGCFCTKMCQFLIGASINSSSHRSSLFLRVRHSRRRRI